MVQKSHVRLAEVKKAHIIGEHRLRATCSMGISVFPQDSDDAAAEAEPLLYDQPAHIAAAVDVPLGGLD